MLIQLQYALKRIFYALLTVFLLVCITFVLMHSMPGEPFTGERVLPDQTMEMIRAKYGLDEPLVKQFLIYLVNAFQGDLGISLSTNRPVTDIIASAFPVSFELGLRALIFALIMGLFLGVLGAVRQGTPWDTISMLVSLMGVSVPAFIIGSLLQYYLGVRLYLQTGIRFFSVTGWDGEQSKILPAFALAFGTMAIVSRLMRVSMLEVLEQDYIKTARAKGLKPGLIIWSHCLRNAALPVVTVMGPLVAALFTGTFVIENIFSIPGLGKYFVSSALTYDYPVIMGTTLFYGTFIVFMGLLVDLLYGLIDPRMKLTEERGAGKCNG